MNKFIKKYIVPAALAVLLGLSACSKEYAQGQDEYTTSKTFKTTKPVFTASSENTADVPVLETPMPSETTVTGQLPEEGDAGFIGPQGTADELKGTCVIVSIFAGDAATSWDDESEADIALQFENLNSLKTAADWLTGQCRGYGREVNFVCDWEENSDLYYRMRFGNLMVRFDSLFYDVQRTYILNEIKSAALMRKYNADSIIYIFFFNTDYSNQINPWSLTYQIDPLCDIEIINSFVRFKYFDTPPATYAHEILHCFGAYDLYYASQQIPQSFVDHCRDTNSQDIMFTVNSGADITVLFSDLDAYYVGLTDNCPLVKEWGLVER